MADNKVQMYCVKGRHKFTAVNPQTVTFKNGRKAWKAPCPNHPKVFSFRIKGKGE